MEILALCIMLLLLGWGFSAYIQALIDAAGSGRWAWLILMLWMWPMFFFYPYSAPVEPYSATAKKLSVIPRVAFFLIALAFLVVIFSGNHKEKTQNISSTEKVPVTSGYTPTKNIQFVPPQMIQVQTSQSHIQLVDNKRDISSLSSGEEAALTMVCSSASMKGPAAYNQCVEEQLSMLESTPSPDISNLSRSEESALSSACLRASMKGPAAYNQCIELQLSILGGR